MKNNIILYSIIFMAISSHAQKQFIHTVSKENISCNYDCTILDLAELNNNPGAIILATPILEKGENLNPHPIGVYYFKNKWSILNLDQRPIPAGAKFSVEYFTKPDQAHFQYSFAKGDIQKDGSAFIDHPALNNNPTAKFTSFISWDPGSQGATTNREETIIQYNKDAGKWSVSNINKKPLFGKATYNIAFSAPGLSSASYQAVQIKELTVTPNTNSVFGNVASIYMTVWGNGNKLPGDNVRSDRLDKTQIHGLEMGASSLIASGQLATKGKRVYEPITIKFHSGWPAAILLLDAFVKNQNMAITIEIYSNTAAGTEELNYTIKLTGASIVSFKQSYEEMGLHLHQGSNGIKKYYDEIKIMFAQIEYTNSVGVTAIDNL